MTAEERAKALCYEVGHLNETLCEHTSSGLACHACILSAIRAAEDEALERAALLVVDEMVWGRERDAGWVADRIRALKTGSGK